MNLRFLSELKMVWVQFLLYFLLGVICFFADLGIFLFLSQFLPGLVSALTSSFLIVTLNYFVSLKWVFKPQQRSAVIQALFFTFVVVIGMGIHGLAFWSIQILTPVSMTLAKVFALIPTIVWNFWARRTLVFSGAIPVNMQSILVKYLNKGS